MSIHDMPEGMKSEFLAAFRAEFGFGEMTATANDDAAAMLKAAAWAWVASRRDVLISLPDDGIEDCRKEQGDSCRDTFDCGYNFASLQHERAIEAAGLRAEVKS